MKVAAPKEDGGKKNNWQPIVLIICGLAALIASFLSFLSIWLQSKNYRKPLLQRYVIRILLMVPIYAFSSWGSLLSVKAAFILDPLRDIYEAFTIYTFFQLLINFLGGERALIIMMHGRAPKNHAWPLNHLLPKIDISDPHTFLAIKRGILQYAWLKPILAFATIFMKAAGAYDEGNIDSGSGYIWVAIIYNVSVTVSLYSLAMFWVCMSQDLQPFRPVPKFLCIKLIIFASYWQGFFLSCLQFLGAIPNGVDGYGSADNLASAIQDALICLEMPLFAIAHWYAFSWHDYADVTISAARMPVKYALRDSFGIRDLIEDTKLTFKGHQYDYRHFDSGDSVMAHEGSVQRKARIREGMRYERGGKGKYWIPKPGEANSKTPLLQGESGPSRSGGNEDHGSIEQTYMDKEDEKLYVSARALEYGDWNYPVITAHVASRDLWERTTPYLVTTSTNRNILQQGKVSNGSGSKDRSTSRTTKRDSSRASSSKTASKEPSVKSKSGKEPSANPKSASKGQSEQDNHPKSPVKRAPIVADLIEDDGEPSKPADGKADRDQLVDLVVEDKDAEERERVRARKEGSPEWNRNEAQILRRNYSEHHRGEEIRQGFEFEPEEINPKPKDENDDEDDKDGGSKGGLYRISSELEDGDNPWS